MTMQAILDFAWDHIETMICAVAGVCFGLAWTVNQRALRLSRDIDAKLREFRAEVDREMAYSAEVARLLETGIELMTPAQVEQWAGVREWLTVNAGHSGPYKAHCDDGKDAHSQRLDCDTASRKPFTLRNANEDLTHPGYPPEYSLTSAEIADRLRVGILDLEEPGDADAGFPDWTPKAQRPF